MTDLTNVNDIIDFMTYTKNGAILTYLLPIETIADHNHNRITRSNYLTNKRITFPF